MFTFVDRGREGLPLKRKQSHRACENCRQRKKRCSHTYRAETAPVRDQDHINRLNATDRTPTERRLEVTEMPDTSWEAQTVPAGASLGNRPQSALPSFPEATMDSSARPRDRDPPSRFSAQTSMYKAGPTPTTQATSSSPAMRQERDSADDPQFIGDLNPEGIFLAGTSPSDTVTSVEDSAGIWLHRRMLDGIRRGDRRRASIEGLVRCLAFSPAKTDG